MFRFGPLLIAAMLLAQADVLQADGGAVRTIERSAGLQISVFTSPNPLVAGPIDLSVLVQDASSLAPVPDANILVKLTPRARAYAMQQLEATQELATNKLFRDCHVELEPGWYDVEISVAAPGSNATIAVPLEVGPRPTRAAAFWPWYTWPSVPILLFALHGWLASRRKCNAGPARSV